MGFLALNVTNPPERTLVVISTFSATGSLAAGLRNSAKHRIAQMYYKHDPTRGVREVHSQSAPMLTLHCFISRINIFSAYPISASGCSHFSLDFL